jgi:hypothetical protein
MIGWHWGMRRITMLLVFCAASWVLCSAQEGSSSSGLRSRTLDGIRLQMEGTREEGLAVKCGFPIVTYALVHRDLLPGPLAKQAGVLFSRPDMQKSILVGGFRIHYDTSGFDAAALLDASHRRIAGSADAFADSVGAILNRVVPVEVGELGYLPPPQDGADGGGPEYDVYVVELGREYGYTTPEVRLNGKAQGATYTSFISIDNDFIFVTPDSNRGLPALRITLAHELFHAIQMGRYAYWTDDVYFYEMCSTWMEDVVFPNVNDYIQYLFSAESHFRSPDLPFTTQYGVYMYSRAVWVHYIAKKFGRDAVRRFWEETRADPPLQAMDNALQEYGSSFRSSFAEWTLWNYFTGSRADTARYYPEGNLYPLITQMGVDFIPPSRDISGTLGALSARYYDVMSSGNRLTLALSNLNLSAGLAKSSEKFGYTYKLNVNRLDESYQPTAAGFYVKLDVPDPTNWYSWNIAPGPVGPIALSAGSPFPDPFRTDGRSSVHVPVTADEPVEGKLSVFSSGMDLVYSATLTSSPMLGKQAFSWNGRTDRGEVAESGIYFYVLEFKNQVLKGKFALLRR